MSITAKPYTFSAGAVIVASEHNANFDALFNLVNGSLDTTNLASNAALVDTQLAQITTASKVSGTALAISGLTTVTAASGDFAIIQDISDSNNPKKALVSDFQTTFTPTAANALAGSIIQVVNTSSGANSTGTTVTPQDDTIPAITEGDEYMTRTVTASSATNKFLIQVVAIAECSSNGGFITMALHQDAVSAALAATASKSVSGGDTQVLVINHFMTTGSTSQITFRVRIGGSAGTIGFNGFLGNGRVYGGVANSSITVYEIKV